MFGKKTGIEALKEKLVQANKELIEAVEHMNKAQAIHNEFYKLLFEVQSFKGCEIDGDN